MSTHSSQDPHVVSMFEVLGAYAVDTVFNHIHHSATLRRTGDTSLTSEYVRSVQAYVLGVKNDEHCYSGVVQGIHKYFTTTTRYSTLSFAEFVDRVVSVCVPADYYRQFTSHDKDELLSSIVCDLVSNLCAYATTPDMLHRVIDEHAASATVTVRMLQDHALKTLVSKRADIINKFLKKMGQARDHVSMDTVEDMKKVLKRLLREKTAAIARAEEAEAALDELEERFEEAKSRERKAMKLIKLLRAGKEFGPEVAGATLAVPKRETIAEGRRPLGSVPPRETIAEGTRGRKDADGPAPRPGKGPAPTAGGVPANFFKIANASEKKTPVNSYPTKPGPPATTQSAKFTDLLSDVVSASDAGESSADDLLREYY